MGESFWLYPCTKCVGGGGPDAAPHTREAHGYRWTWKDLIAVEVLSITLIPVAASPFSAVCSEIKHGFPFPTPSAKAGLHILYWVGGWEGGLGKQKWYRRMCVVSTKGMWQGQNEEWSPWGCESAWKFTNQVTSFFFPSYHIPESLTQGVGKTGKFDNHLPW